MANIYVRSTDGSNADNGSTWALAKASLAGADAIDAAGDNIYVSQVHSETSAATVTLTFAGTTPNPTRLVCANDGAQPPTAVAATAVVATTTTAQIVINGSLYAYGIAFKCGSGASNGSIGTGVAGNIQIFDNCAFWIVNTGASSVIAPVEANPCKNIWNNCQVKFGATGQSITFTQNNGTLVWSGGDVASGSAVPVTLFKHGTSTGIVLFVENVDFTNLGAMFLTSPPNARSSVVFRNCKLPAGCAPLSSAISAGEAFVALYNVDSGSTNYKLWIERYEGTIRDETTLVRTGGASDGTTTLSWKMVSNANVVYPTFTLASDEIVMWNEITGISRTVTVDILHDSATNLKDDEVWLEVRYQSDSSSPKGSTVLDLKANILATAADQTASSATWTTTGLANPNKQALAVTFTPQKKGFFIARVVLAKASKTIYVDPKLTVT